MYKMYYEHNISLLELNNYKLAKQGIVSFLNDIKRILTENKKQIFPYTNSLERTIQIINTTTKRSTISSPTNWINNIKLILFGYESNPH